MNWSKAWADSLSKFEVHSGDQIYMIASSGVNFCVFLWRYICIHSMSDLYIISYKSLYNLSKSCISIMRQVSILHQES